MGFQDELSKTVYEIVQVAFAGFGYSEDGQIQHRQTDDETMFKFPTNCSPADIWDAYEPFFNTCDPATGDPTASLFFDAAHELHAAQYLHFSDVAGNLEEWSGDAADAFKERLQELWWSTANMQTLLEEFSTLYKGYQALIQGTQGDALRLADATLSALKAYREAQSRQSRQAEMLAATFAITAIATVATAGLALPATAAGAATTALVTGTAISVAKDGIQTAMAISNLKIEGSDPTEIMESMFSGVSDLLANTRTQAEAIIAGITSAADAMRDTNFVPRVPEEIYQPFDPEEFRVPSDVMPDSIAASASHDPLVEGKPGS